MANAYTSVTSIQPSATVVSTPSQVKPPHIASGNGHSNIYYERRKNAVKATR